MSDLRLLAMDKDDLDIVSAHMQDSVFKAPDIAWDAKRQQFSVAVNRFVWEKSDRRAKGHERRRALLVFKRVQAVRSINVSRGNEEVVHALLAVRFEPKGEGPEGTVELTLAGDAAISLDVECIEAQLADTGGAWETTNRPDHA